LPVPDDFGIPTCSSCGEEYFTTELGEALAERQAAAYAAWQREHCGRLVNEIQRRREVTLRQIEGVCGVSATYLSHVLSGTKEASATLIRLLEAYAREPQEFARQLRGEPWMPQASTVTVSSSGVSPSCALLVALVSRPSAGFATRETPPYAALSALPSTPHNDNSAAA
jgi:transcriptional regulator with XRE-family HTH domain